MSGTIEQFKQHFENQRDAIIRDFASFLKFGSVSSDPAYVEEVHACKEWVKSFLKDSNFQVEEWPTSEYPIVFAQDLSAGEDKPTVLIYNHYDVQPVDPLELWDNPPFEPTLKEDTIYARGAQDNKGQCFYVLQALKAYRELNGNLPLNVKLLIEGNEETGSGGLAGVLEQKKNQLKADYLLVVDLGITAPDKPCVTLGMRGCVALEVTCKGSDADLHSGCHGGIAYNPIHALAYLLSKLRDSNGHIAVPRFYDTIQELTEEQKKCFSFDWNQQEYFREFGVHPTGGENHLTPLERNWLRPTLEIVGVTGGYSGPGIKTVIPATASAKISCRLVVGQDPESIKEAVAGYLESLAPPGITVTTHLFPGGGTATITDPASTSIQAVARAYEEVFDSPCDYILTGATIPIAAQLQKVCGGEMVLMGLGLGSDRIHSPNEHFTIKRLLQGYLIIARSLEILGETKNRS